MKYPLLLISFSLYACNAIIVFELPSGTPLWARNPDTDNTNSEFLSTSSGVDGVYSAGYLSKGEILLGGGVTANGIANNTNLLLAKYDVDGKALWAKYPFAADDNSRLTCIKYYQEAIYAVGNVSSGALDLGDSVTIESFPHSRMLLVKYSSVGQTIFAKAMEGTADCSAQGIDVDDEGIFITGFITGPGYIDFGNDIKLNLSNIKEKGFIVKFDKNGIAQWLKTVKSDSDSIFSAITLSSEGIYIAGNVFGNDLIDFGNSVKISGQNSEANPLIVKYDFSGNAVWARTTVEGTNGRCNFSCIDVNDGIVCVCGQMTGQNEFTFDTGSKLYGKSIYSNLVVVAYDENGTPLWARTNTSGSHFSAYSGIYIDDSSIYTSGVCDGFDTFGFGNGVFIDAFGSGNPLLVKYNTNGIAQWAKTFSSPTTGKEYANYASIDSCNDAVYVTGFTSFGAFNFGNNVTANGLAWENLLLVKYKK